MNSFTPITKLYTLSLIPSPVYGPSRASTPIVVVSRTCVDCGLVRTADVVGCPRCADARRWASEQIRRMESS